MISSTDLLTPGEIATYYAARTPSLKQKGSEWRAGCFVHGGKDLNFSVKAETGEWYCHSQCNRGGSVYDLEMELTGAAFREAAAEVRQIIGRADHRSNVSAAAHPVSGPTKLSPWSKKFLEERIRQTMDHESLEFVAAYRYHHAIDGLPGPRSASWTEAATRLSQLTSSEACNVVMKSECRPPRAAVSSS